MMMEDPDYADTVRDAGIYDQLLELENKEAAVAKEPKTSFYRAR
jgi:hypothetical protein